MSQPLKIVFAGTPDFAARHLTTLINSKHEIIAVYTQPDRPAGRGKKLTSSPVKCLAEQHSIPVYQPKNFKASSDKEVLNELGADLMVVVAYGLLLPQAVLDIPRLGCINVHGSILPRWRGAAPIRQSTVGPAVRAGACAQSRRWRHGRPLETRRAQASVIAVRIKQNGPAR